MKKVLLSVVLVIVSFISKAQCTYPPFATAHVFYINKGVGFELGAWPTKEGRLGGFLGVLALQEKQQVYDIEKNQTTNAGYISGVLYAKGQYRFHRYFHLTAALGTKEFKEKFTSVGVRFGIPFGSGSRGSIVVEPQMTNTGFRNNIGIVVALQ